jgi:hypothetical protein
MPESIEGKQEMTPAELSAKIEGAIRSLLTDHTVTTFLRATSDTLRTSLIKSRLRDLARILGFQVSASGCAADDREWLYDMVWFTRRRDGLFAHQAMVMESEWRNGVKVTQSAEVDSDFEKLVQARADVHVWICTVPNPDKAREHIQNCKRQIAAFSGTMPDDHYLFVILRYLDDDFEIEAFRPLQ